MNTNEYVSKWRGMMGVMTKIAKENFQKDIKFEILIEVDENSNVIAERIRLVSPDQDMNASIT